MTMASSELTDPPDIIDEPSSSTKSASGPARPPPLSLLSRSGSSSSAFSSLSSPNATPRPTRGIKRRVPDHPTPLTERGGGGGHSGSEFVAAAPSPSLSPRKRQGRSSSVASTAGGAAERKSLRSTPSRNGTPYGHSRRNSSRRGADTPLKAENVGQDGDEDGAVHDADPLPPPPRSPSLSPEERKEAEMLQNWKDEYFEVIEQLPLELHRSSALMKELEAQIHAHMQQIQHDAIAYRDHRKASDAASSTTPYRRHPTLDRISQSCSTAMASAEEKVGLALSAYNLIDRHCRRLDADLAKMTGVQGGAAGGVVAQEGEAKVDPAAASSPTAPGTTTATATAAAPFELRENTQESSRSQRMSGRALRGRASGIDGNVGAADDTMDASTSRAGLRSRRSAVVSANDVTSSGSPSAAPRRKTGTLVAQNQKSITTTPTTTTATETSPPIPDMPVDPNEPVYCYCRGPSSGTMVGCDNEDCAREWFHLPCVGLTVVPPEHVKWYCKECRPDANAERAGGGRKGKKGVKKK